MKIGSAISMAMKISENMKISEMKSEERKSGGVA